MTFKLSEQLDSLKDPSLFFDIYNLYLKDNFTKFPRSVLELLENNNWHGGSASNAPYYSDLESFSISDLRTKLANATLKLVKNEYVAQPFEIEIVYKGVFKVDIPNEKFISERPLKWRYEQFLFYDASKIDKIEGQMFTHQIEWVGGKIWSISARDIEVSWRNRGN